MPAKRNKTSIWPKAIIGYFVIVISCIVVFVTWAVRQNVDLVRPDYYAEELRFQEQINRIEHTRDLATQGSITYDSTVQQLTIAVPSEQIGRISSGTIQLYRPSNARLDRKVDLNFASDGKQRLDATQLEAGLWKVRVFWKCEGKEFYLDNSILVAGKES